jgi:hypothetical protein
MAETIGKLIRGEITPARANAVVRGLRGLRSALDFGAARRPGYDFRIEPKEPAQVDVAFSGDLEFSTTYLIDRSQPPPSPWALSFLSDIN